MWTKLEIPISEFASWEVFEKNRSLCADSNPMWSDVVPLWAGTLRWELVKKVSPDPGKKVAYSENRVWLM